VDRDNEVNRILWAFKLNPYEKLNLRFDATVEEIRKQFRKISLLVHPDKCSHPQAASAFDGESFSLLRLAGGGGSRGAGLAGGLRCWVLKQHCKRLHHSPPLQTNSPLQPPTATHSPGCCSEGAAG